MHYGQIMQSHALHFFHLVIPDLLFGFDSDVARRNILGVAAAHPEVARQGVLLRKFGQDVIRFTAGKRVHGTGSVPGGVNRHLTRRGTRRARRTAARRCRPGASRRWTWWRGCTPPTPRSTTASAACRRRCSRWCATTARWSCTTAGCACATPRARSSWPVATRADYLALIGEQVRPWSYMKFPYLRALGPDAGWYRVGPLARVQNCDRIATPRAEQRRLQLARARRRAARRARLRTGRA